MESVVPRQSRAIPVIAWSAIVIGLGALAMRLGLMGAPAEFDELYHVLAARGILETGDPTILDGQYVRGALFTRTVAAMLWLTGDTGLATARIVSVIAGTLIPVVLFLWLARVATIAVGAVAAAFAILWPQAIIEAQFVRFYAVHVLFFLSGAAAIHLALDTSGRTRVTLILGAAACWALALGFQVTTAIGAAGVLLATFLILAARHVRTVRGRLLTASICLSLVVVGLGIGLTTGLLEKAMAFYRWVPDHAAALRDYRTFYFDQLERSYGTLWYATLILGLLALRARPGLTVFCATAFLSTFLVHSFGGMKALRYLSYAMPFLFTIWAIGILDIAHLALRRLPRLGLIAPAAAIFVALAAVTPFAQRSLTLATGQGLPARGDWSEARSVIGDWIDAPFVATTRELHQIAHVGPYDMLISRSRVTELVPPQDFGIDVRTGRPVIAEPASLARMFDCRPDGLLVTSPHWWEVEGHAERLAPMIATRGYGLEIRQAGAVLAVRWRGAAATGCETLAPPVAAAD